VKFNAKSRKKNPISRNMLLRSSVTVIGYWLQRCRQGKVHTMTCHEGTYGQ